MMQAIKTSFEAGGWPMYLILSVSIFVIGICAERINELFVKVRKLNKSHFVAQITGFITSGNYNRALTYCDVFNTPLTRIVKAGLVVAPKSDEETQAAMDEQSMRELPKLERRTGYLAMLGNVSTLIGLFGTILGLIHSFGAVASADPSEKAALLARGISEAMNCTAFGLLVAIPALICFSIFQGRTQHMVDDINEAAVTILNLVTNNRRQLRSGQDTASAGR